MASSLWDSSASEEKDEDDSEESCESRSVPALRLSVPSLQAALEEAQAEAELQGRAAQQARRRASIIAGDLEITLEQNEELSQRVASLERALRESQAREEQLADELEGRRRSRRISASLDGADAGPGKFNDLSRQLAVAEEARIECEQERDEALRAVQERDVAALENERTVTALQAELAELHAYCRQMCGQSEQLEHALAAEKSENSRLRIQAEELKGIVESLKDASQKTSLSGDCTLAMEFASLDDDLGMTSMELDTLRAALSASDAKALTESEEVWELHEELERLQAVKAEVPESSELLAATAWQEVHNLQCELNGLRAAAAEDLQRVRACTEAAQREASEARQQLQLAEAGAAERASAGESTEAELALEIRQLEEEASRSRTDCTEARARGEMAVNSAKAEVLAAQQDLGQLQDALSVRDAEISAQRAEASRLRADVEAMQEAIGEEARAGARAAEKAQCSATRAWGDLEAAEGQNEALLRHITALEAEVRRCRAREQELEELPGVPGSSSGPGERGWSSHGGIASELEAALQRLQLADQLRDDALRERDHTLDALQECEASVHERAGVVVALQAELTELQQHCLRMCQQSEELQLNLTSENRENGLLRSQMGELKAILASHMEGTHLASPTVDQSLAMEISGSSNERELMEELEQLRAALSSSDAALAWQAEEASKLRDALVQAQAAAQEGSLRSEQEVCAARDEACGLRQEAQSAQAAAAQALERSVEIESTARAEGMRLRQEVEHARAAAARASQQGAEAASAAGDEMSSLRREVEEARAAAALALQQGADATSAATLESAAAQRRAEQLQAEVSLGNVEAASERELASRCRIAAEEARVEAAAEVRAQAEAHAEAAWRSRRSSIRAAGELERALRRNDELGQWVAALEADASSLRSREHEVLAELEARSLAQNAAKKEAEQLHIELSGRYVDTQVAREEASELREAIANLRAESSQDLQHSEEMILAACEEAAQLRQMVECMSAAAAGKKQTEQLHVAATQQEMSELRQQMQEQEAAAAEAVRCSEADFKKAQEESSRLALDVERLQESHAAEMRHAQESASVAMAQWGEVQRLEGAIVETSSQSSAAVFKVEAELAQKQQDLEQVHAVLAEKNGLMRAEGEEAVELRAALRGLRSESLGDVRKCEQDASIAWEEAIQLRQEVERLQVAEADCKWRDHTDVATAQLAVADLQAALRQHEAAAEEGARRNQQDLELANIQASKLAQELRQLQDAEALEAKRTSAAEALAAERQQEAEVLRAGASGISVQLHRAAAASSARSEATAQELKLVRVEVAEESRLASGLRAEVSCLQAAAAARAATSAEPVAHTVTEARAPRRQLGQLKTALAAEEAGGQAAQEVESSWEALTEQRGSPQVCGGSELALKAEAGRLQRFAACTAGLGGQPQTLRQHGQAQEPAGHRLSSFAREGHLWAWLCQTAPPFPTARQGHHGAAQARSGSAWTLHGG